MKDSEVGSGLQDVGLCENGIEVDREHDLVFTGFGNPVNHTGGEGSSRALDSRMTAAFEDAPSPKETIKDLPLAKRSKGFGSTSLEGDLLERGPTFDGAHDTMLPDLLNSVTDFSADISMSALTPVDMSFASPLHPRDTESSATRNEKGDTDRSAGDDRVMHGVVEQHPTSSLPSDGLGIETASVPRSEALLDLLYQTSGRFRVNGGGEIHFFGSNSNHPKAFVADDDSTSSSRTPCLWSNALGGFSALQDSLLDQFWAHPAPYIRLLDREAFMEGLKNGVRTPYFSPLLLTTVFLRALRFSDSPLACRLAPGLLERAQEQLAEESEDPGSTTVISLLMLSNYVASQSRQGLGWLYTGKPSLTTNRVRILTGAEGVAARMIFELGMHQDCTKLRKLGYVTKKQCEERKAVFWMAFVNDL